MIYLFNPINCIKTPTNYNLLSGICDLPSSTLMCMESRKQKISSLNCYIISDDTDKKQLAKWIKQEVIKDEVWVNIYGTESKYQVSSYGRIRKYYAKSDKYIISNQYLKINNKNFLIVKLTINGVGKEYNVQDIVAEHFIGDKPEGYKVYHKNGNKYDNYFQNLEYKTSKDIGHLTAGKAKAIPVLKIDPITKEVLDEYDSMAEAGRCNFLHRESIRLCVRGVNKTSGGFLWKIDEEFYNNKTIGGM